MKTVELIGYVDEQHRLTGEVPLSIGPGPVRLHLIVGSDDPRKVDPGEADWEIAVAHEWEADWADPREDLYTPEDGEPIHDAR